MRRGGQTEGEEKQASATSSPMIRVAVLLSLLGLVVLALSSVTTKHDWTPNALALLQTEEAVDAKGVDVAGSRYMTCMDELRRKWRGMDDSQWKQADQYIPFSTDAILGFSDETTGDLREARWTEDMARARATPKMSVFKNHHSDTSDLERSGMVKFLYGDNTVVVADLDMCQVTGVYEPTPEGDMDPRVSLGLPMRSPKVGEDIAYGRTTVTRDFTVRLGTVGQNGQPGNGFCSGVLLSSTMVLTAEHCLDDVTATTLEIIAGAATITDSANRQIRKSVEFVKKANVDLALVRVGEAFVLNDYVKTVELLMGYEAADWVVEASGYGHDERWTGMSPKRKRAEMTTKTNTFCKNHDGRFKEGDELCCVGGTSGNKGNTCNGDSGGPLTYLKENRKALLGVNSWSQTNCWQSGNVDIFVSVPDHLGWIVAWVGHFSGHTQPVVYASNCKQTQWTPAGQYYAKGSEVVVDCAKAT